MNRASKEGGHLPEKDCANCGATSGLLRCSRCRNIWYCSVQCHKAYWPVHKSSCRANDFASAIEASEPQFAAFLRNHGKQAVIKDDEVERLERASKAVCASPSRQDMLQSMYGRANPKPIAPSFSAEEWLAMSQRQQDEADTVALLSPQERAWLALPTIEPGFGRNCGMWRWTQDLSHVDVAIKVPGDVESQQVDVRLGQQHMVVLFDTKVFMQGSLCREVDRPGCTWFVDVETGILHIQLLKRSRWGRYLTSSQIPPIARLPPSTSHTLRLTPGTGDQRAPAGEQVPSIAPALQQQLISLPDSKDGQQTCSRAPGEGTGVPSHALRQVASPVLARPVDGAQQSQEQIKPRPATAADTYWRSLLQGASHEEVASDQYAPSAYYTAGHESDD